MHLLFLKAIIRGGAGTDLFATQVDVGGYTTASGTYVAPHHATRHKRHLILRPLQPVQGDLFSRGGRPAPHIPPSQPALFDLSDLAPKPKPAAAPVAPSAAVDAPAAVVDAPEAPESVKTGSKYSDPIPETPPPAEPPPPPAPVEAEKPAPKNNQEHNQAAAPKPKHDARAQLAATTAKLDELAHTMRRRLKVIQGDAERHARSLEPGRGKDFGRGATTWTVRQEGWYHEALREGVEKERKSLTAAMATYDRVLAQVQAQETRLGVNQPYSPASASLTELRDLLAGKPAPQKLIGKPSWAKKPKASPAEAEAAPEPQPEEVKPEEPKAAPKAVPAAIKYAVRRALAAMGELAQSLADGRTADAKFQGQGRYEVDAWENTAERRAAAAAFMAKFRANAVKLGIDPEETVRELGGEPAVELSDAGQAYLAGKGTAGPATAADPVEQAVAATNPDPTPAERESGDYAKGKLDIGGLTVAIETPAGTKRREEWPPLAHHYGEVEGTRGADGDPVDVFLGPNAADPANPVYVVDQVKRTGAFDEHKAMLGFASEDAAREGYLANYTPDWQGLGAITRMEPDQFRAWVQDPERTAKPAAAPPPPAEPVRDFGVPAGTKASERKKLNAKARAILAAKADGEMTAEDRQDLARYTGSGGTGDSLNEFYTPEAVAGAMWSMLRAAGFQGGEVLEPSCGTGVFAHTRPDGARMTMVEMDATSSRIARLVHPDAEVHTASLERFATQDGRQFDAVIGNPPYCGRGSLLKDDKKDLARAEHYFLDTALDKAKDGGLVALIVPTGIMDNASNRGLRERLLRKGEFIGGARMPNTCFAASHTEVTTDILLFRKRPQDVAGALGTVSQDQLRALGVWDHEFLAGSYFMEGEGAPHVMGRIEPGWRAKYGRDDLTVTGSMEGVPEALERWTPRESPAPSPTVPAILESLSGDMGAQRRAVAGALKPPYQVAQIGDIQVIDGVRYVLDGQPPRWHRADQDVPAAVEDAQRIAELLEDLAEGRAKDPAFSRANLIESLDDFVREHGLPTRNKDVRAWLAAPHLARHPDTHPEDHAHHVELARRRMARVLGAVNDDGSYSDLVTGATRGEVAELGTIATKLALEQGGFTPEQLATAANRPVDELLDQLHADPAFAIEADGRTWNTLDGYLTGELWPKLDAARAAAADAAVAEDLRTKYRGQVEALEKAIDPQSLEDVEITLTAGFVQAADIEAWLNQHGRGAKGYRVGFDDAAALWSVTDGEGGYVYGDADLLERMLNRRGVKKDEREKIEGLHRAFREWVLGSDRREAMEDRYNRAYRGFRQKAFSDAPIHIAGFVSDGLKTYQWPGVRWALAAGKGIIAADVGLGKTVRGLMLAALAKQTGQAKRPTFVVPKSVLSNWHAESQKWFPGSKVLIIGETLKPGRDGQMRSVADDAATRQQKFQQLQQNDYDFVFISQPAWNSLDITPELKSRYQGDDFWERRAAALEGASDKKRNKLRTSHDQAMAAREFDDRENTAYFDKLGIDMLICDEGHAYKNLFAARNRYGESPKFLGGSGESKRALDTFYKSKALRDANGGRGVFMLTATPTKNSPLEVYSMLSHIAPEAFERLGIKNSEEFLDRFCTFETRNILGLNGEFEDELVVTGFKNLGELREVMRRYIDRKTAADVGLELPERQDHQHDIDMTPAQEAKYVELRALAADNSKDDDTGEAHIFSIMDKMQKATLDLALIDPAFAGEACPKLEACAAEVGTRAADGGQIVFCEAIDLHQKIADLVASKGIPRERIAILNGATAASSAARQAISDAFNAGKLDVVIANKTAEEGVNLQKRTADIHHLDIPWEPATLQQRNGRGLRQGNTLEGVRIHTYLARKSFDLYRWQTVKAKKDWQDLLWNGGDTVENLALSAASREEMQIALSDDPQAAMRELAKRRKAAADNKAGIARTKGAADFARYQGMRKSIAALKAKGAEGEALERLEYRAGNLRQLLEANGHFAHKDLLDREDAVYIEPSTDTAWTRGKGFELAGGKEGPIHWSDTPSRWVVDSVTTGEDGKPRINARPYGQPGIGRVMSMDATRFRAGVTPVPYDEEQENADILAKARKDAEDRADSVTSLAELKDMPGVAVEARAAELQARLKESIAAYKNSKDQSNDLPLVAPDGTPVLPPSYETRKLLATHDLLLPNTAAGRAKAIEGFVAHAEARKLKSHEVQSSRSRRSSYSYKPPTYDGIEAAHPSHNHTILTEPNNRWERPLKEYFGPEAVAEAKAQVLSRAVDRIGQADSFRDAVAAAQPAVALSDYSRRVLPQFWPKEVVAALRAKAEALGVLNQSMADAAPADAGRFNAGRIHPGMFDMALPNGTYRDYSGREVPRTRPMSTAWSVDAILRGLAGDLAADASTAPTEKASPPPPPPPRVAPPPAPVAPPPPPVAEPAPISGSVDSGPTQQPEPPAERYNITPIEDPPPPAAAPAAVAAKPEVVTYTTRKGKELQGIIRKDLTLEQGKRIDPYAFRYLGGIFIRTRHVPELAA